MINLGTFINLHFCLCELKENFLLLEEKFKATDEGEDGSYEMPVSVGKIPRFAIYGLLCSVKGYVDNINENVLAHINFLGRREIKIFKVFYKKISVYEYPVEESDILKLIQLGFDIFKKLDNVVISKGEFV